MKRIAALILVVLFAASTIPAFAGEQPAKERNLFVIIKNSIKPGEGKPKNQLRNPLPTVTVFQNMANSIEGCPAKAKKENLHTEAVK